MLQALLEDRFNLKIHRETRDIPVYELTVAKGGPKLRPPPVPPSGSGIAGAGLWPMSEADCKRLDPRDLPDAVCGAGRAADAQGDKPAFVEYHGLTLDEISAALVRVLDRPVIDKTGVAGIVHVHFEFAPDGATPQFRAAPGDEPAGPSIFTAFQEQLGLKLEPAKRPGEFLVIDSIGRPSEN
jgi:uncharacterized protein (TIGR03435 family)